MSMRARITNSLFVVLTNEFDVSTCEMSTCVLKMDQCSVGKFLGLRKYCDTYGRMSESVTLSEGDEQFKYWHVRAPLEDEEVNVLLSGGRDVLPA